MEQMTIAAISPALSPLTERQAVISRLYARKLYPRSCPSVIYHTGSTRNGTEQLLLPHNSQAVVSHCDA